MVSIHNFKAELCPTPVNLISRNLFESTPEEEEVTYDEELKHIIDSKDEDETIVVS